MKSPLLKIAFLLVCIPLWSQTAAPTPSKAPADVISVFSDAYTNLNANINPNWGQQTQTSVIQIDGNNTLEYANLNYQGLQYTQTDVSAMEYVHLDYKTADATSIEFFLISAAPTVENAYIIRPVTGGWQSVDIPLSVYSANKDRVFQFKTVGNGTVYLDNIYFWKAPAAAGTDTSLSDLTVNGSTIAGFGPTSASYSLELPVGTSSVPVVAVTTTDINASAVITAATSIPGTTTVVVTAQDGTTTGTVSINWTLDPKPQTAAPVPSQDSADVISVYSDAFTENIATNLNPGWGQATQTTEFQIDGNNALEYANLNYQGLEYPQTDVSAMEYLHLDYFTNDATALDLFLISTGPLENSYPIPIVTGSWQSIDIPLTEYTVPELDKAIQFKTVGNGTVYIDNLYFWKAPTAAGTDTTLSALTVDGNSIADFGASKSSYSVELPQGTTVVPTVAATPTDTNASAVVTAATSIPGTTTVVVTAQDGTTTNTVSINWTIDPTPTSAAPTPTWESDDVISVYSDAYESIATDLNPAWDQTTQTSEVQIDGNNTLEYKNLNYQGMDYPETDVEGMGYLHLDYFTNDATALEFFLITNGGDGTDETTYDIAASESFALEQWVSLDIPMTFYSDAGQDLAKAFQFKTEGNGTVYLDNLYFWKAPTAAGTDTTLSALTVDGNSIADFGASKTSYSVELPQGTTVVPTVAATPTDTNASAVVTAATSLPGTTTIVVTAQDGTTTNTVSINWTIDPTPTSAAPTPTWESDDVISVYSDAYTSIATDLNPAWDQTTQTSEVQIDGNNTLEYKNLNYQGLEYPETDVSAMEYLHLDYYTNDATALDLFLISTGSLENSYPIPVVTGSWQSIDIPLSEYTVPELDKAIQFKTEGNGTVYLDNLYFWKAPVQSTDTSLSALTVDGNSIADFAALKTSYSVELPAGTTVVPTVAATTTDTNASAVVTAATSLPGTTTIVVTAQDGTTTNTVSIAFSVASTPPTGSSAAPTPNKAPADVISVYSDAYTNLNANLDPFWGQQTDATEIQIDGNNTLEYANLNYQGLQYTQTDVSAMEYVHLDYKTADASALDFYLISANPTLESAYSIPVVTGEWQSVDIPLSVYSANKDRVFQFKTVGNGTVYLDNLYFWKAPAPAGTDISLSDLTVNGSTIAGFGPTSASYSLELPVGTTSVPVVAVTTTDINASAVITAATSIPGTTTVVVTAQDGTTTSTVSINWTLDPKPQTAAPIPSQDSSDVISVYSDAYTDNIGTNGNPGWGQATQTTEFQIDGNNTLEYANLNYQGFEYSTTDVSAMEYVHLDYYTDDATALEFFVISEGKENAYSIPVVTGSWQSIDISMSEYTVANLTQAFQFKTVGNGTVYIDNLYFWKAPTAAGTDTTLSALTVDGNSIADFGASKSSYSVELPQGTTVVPTVAATPTDTNASAVVTAATSIPGTTTVVVTAQDGTTTNTVSINWTIDPTPTSAAPTPTWESDDVISVYSDAYESIATDLNPAWGQATVFSEIDIDGNNTLEYKNLNYQGLEYPETDVSAMRYLHLDYYTNNTTSLEFFLITNGVDGTDETAYDIAASESFALGQWVSLDIPLTFYSDAGQDLSKAVQIKTEGDGTVCLNNIYFYDSDYAGIGDVQKEAIQVAPNPTEGLINKTGDIYNVSGQKVLTNSNDLSRLPSGIYFIKVISNGNVSTSKIIKK